MTENKPLEEFFAEYARLKAETGMQEDVMGKLFTELEKKTSEHREETEKRRRGDSQKKRLIAIAEKLRKEAETDELTGLLNRRGFEKFVIGMQKKKIEGTLLFLDGDDFKRINNKYGHGVGDQAIAAISNYLKDNSRQPTDAVCRLGGDEFVVFFSQAKVEDILIKFGKLDERGKYVAGSSKIEVPFVASEGKKENLLFSGGIANLSPDDDLKVVLKKADETLYKVKHTGKNQLQIY